MQKTRGALGLLSAGLVLLVGTSPALADSVDDYHNSGYGRALQHQRQLNLDVPLAEQNFWGTHNTFNSSAHGYPFPNQLLSVGAQLRLGAQFIEFDVHDMWNPVSGSWPWESDYWEDTLYLCHGVCDITNDSTFSHGLGSWLRPFLQDPDYADQVLILYLEDHAESEEHGKMAGELEDEIGPWIYESGGCQDIPSTLTPRDVLNAGKRVVIWADGGCSGNGHLRDMVFTGLGAVERHFESKPIGCDFDSHDGCDDIEPSEAGDLFESGANFMAYDLIEVGEVDLEAIAWSWAAGEPNNSGGQEDCAIQSAGSPNPWFDGDQWQDRRCDESHRVACQSWFDERWEVTSIAVPFHLAQRQCELELGWTYFFSAPINAQDNLLLSYVKDDAGASEIWVNASDHAMEGRWTSRNIWNAPQPVAPDLEAIYNSLLPGLHLVLF